MHSECQNIKNGGLDQYGVERFGRLTFATIRKRVGLEGLILRFISLGVSEVTHTIGITLTPNINPTNQGLIHSTVSKSLPLTLPQSY